MRQTWQFALLQVAEGVLNYFCVAGHICGMSVKVALSYLTTWSWFKMLSCLFFTILGGVKITNVASTGFKEIVS